MLRNRGTRLPVEKSHSLVPLRVRICVMLVVKRPYSAANGLARTSTDSTLCAGQVEIEVAGRRVDQAGAADLQRARVSADRRGCAGGRCRREPRPGSSGSRLRKSSPWSGAVSKSVPDSMSLIDTGCTLLVADGAVGAHLDVRRREGQLRIEQDLRGLVRAGR